jgi:hypothetical protein
VAVSPEANLQGRAGIGEKLHEEPFRGVLPGVTGEALQFFLQPLVVGVVLKRALVGKVGFAGFGV